MILAGRTQEKLDRVRAEIEEELERLDLDGPDDELKQLADTFDDMLGRIDDAFESQRRFIHEASHELRNPLAAISGSVQYLKGSLGPSGETLELIDAHQITNVHLVPTQFVRLLRLDEATRRSFDGSSLEQVLHGGSPIIGLMLESNLVAGNQKMGDSMTYGQSITDACVERLKNLKNVRVIQLKSAAISDEASWMRICSCWLTGNWSTIRV